MPLKVSAILIFWRKGGAVLFFKGYIYAPLWQSVANNAVNVIKKWQPTDEAQAVPCVCVCLCVPGDCACLWWKWLQPMAHASHGTKRSLFFFLHTVLTDVNGEKVCYHTEYVYKHHHSVWIIYSCKWIINTKTTPFCRLRLSVFSLIEKSKVILISLDMLDSC